jgi:hypothetical protein
MNTLTFEIAPSPTSNDHQVRIRIDGKDWLGAKYLGVDPPRFFAQAALISGGNLLAGRCECGCEGCDDIRVDVLRDDHEVLWKSADGLQVHFKGEDYDRLIAAAGADFSWEDTNRTAERLVSGVLAGVVVEDRYKFDWASARVRGGIMTLSFSRGSSQKLFEFGWDGKSPDNAIAGANCFFSDLK